MLIRISHTCVALLHKKTVLTLETSSDINFEFIKFVKKGKCLPLTKTNREYYINITFPDWVIVENIIPRNVIITFPEFIFSNITQSENVIFILLKRILGPVHMHTIYTCKYFAIWSKYTHISKSIFNLRSHANSVHKSILKVTLHQLYFDSSHAQTVCCKTEATAVILFVYWVGPWAAS